MKRTHLPLNGLRVLDAAARHLSFTRAADELALSRLRAACADREVVGVDARVFIRQNGSLHCSCMNKFNL